MNIKRNFIVSLAIALTLPVSAFAAYNDVTLGTSAVISVGGLSYTVSGSSASLSSIVVNSGSFKVHLLTNSTLKVTSADKSDFGLSSSPVGVSGVITCGSTSSLTVSLDSTSALTESDITVTPSGTCTAAVSTSSTSSSAGGGGGPAGSFGGSGGSGYSFSPITTATAVSKPSVTTSAVSTATSAMPTGRAFLRSNRKRI